MVVVPMRASLVGVSSTLMLNTDERGKVVRALESRVRAGKGIHGKGISGEGLRAGAGWAVSAGRVVWTPSAMRAVRSP